MLANIRQHAAYIASTIGYVDDQIAADSTIVTDASVCVFILSLCAPFVMLMIGYKNPPCLLSEYRKRRLISGRFFCCLLVCCAVFDYVPFPMLFVFVFSVSRLLLNIGISKQVIFLTSSLMSAV